MNEVKVTDSTALVLEILIGLVHVGVVSINRKKVAEKVGLTPSQVSRSFKELEAKGVIFYSPAGHMYLDKALCGIE